MRSKVTGFLLKGFLGNLAISLGVLILASCGSGDAENIQGNWYSFDRDSVYFELYINDTMIVLNQQPIGPIGYDYALQDGKLIVSNAVGMERIWQIRDIKSETMTLQDSLETLQYSRLRLNKDFFSSLRDSSGYREFSENFKTRFALHSKQQ